LVQADAGLQTVLANGLIDLSADASSVTVNSETADQVITATTGSITLDADNSATIAVTANTTQDITATAGNLVVDAVDSTINVLADTGAQTILANGLMDVNADNSAITIDATGSTQSITATTGAITIDAINASTVEVTAADQQDITATAGTIAVTANASSVTVQNTTGTQTLTAGTDITVDAQAASTVLVQADAGLQTVLANGLIDLSADASSVTVNSETADQVITATTGATNLTGTNGGQTLVSAIDITLNNVGGVLTGDAVIGTAGTTETVTINNSAAITIASAPVSHVHVNADTNGAAITFAGAGSVGGTGAGERLVTNTAAYVFTDAAKTVALDERVGSVTVEGTVGDLNLILTDAAGGTITDAAAFTATTATLQTVNGSIDLGTTSLNAVQVDTFAGLIAQGTGSSITYTGTGSTTFANRAISDGIVAGAGVSADAGIEIITATGVTTITADLVEVTGTGNIAVNAASLVLNATNADTGGDYNTADLNAVGMIRTNDGMQTYNAPVVLLTNTHISANGAVDTVTFNDTINGPGGLEIGSTPVFNDFIGDVSPLAYLILNSNSFFNANSGNPALGSATVNLSGSFINKGTMTLGNPLGGVNQNFTFIVDSGTPAVGGSIFQGGLIANHISQDAVNGSFITVFGAAFGSITFDNIGVGTSLYESYTFNPGFSYTDPFTVFTPGFLYFKGPQTITYESERERLEREADEKASSLAYDGSVIPEGILALAGKLAEAPGTAGGVATSTFDIVPTGQVETFTQTVFSHKIVLP
jgi:hypothetical protein